MAAVSKLIKDGSYFDVEIVKGLVIKTPKQRPVQKPERLEFIVAVQNYLAEHIDNILPCCLCDGKIIMPVAPGVRLDKCEVELGAKRSRFTKVMKRRIGQLGYEIFDYSSQNIFYDEHNDKFYLIDLHDVRPITW